MMKTVKPTGRAMSMPGGLALSAAVSIGITLVGSLILAKVVHSSILHPDKIGYGILILLLSASFMGAMTAQGKIKHRKAMVCMLSGLTYFLVLISITALFFGGQYQGIGVTALLVLAGSGTACFAATGKTGRSHRRSKHHSMRIR